MTTDVLPRRRFVFTALAGLGAASTAAWAAPASAQHMPTVAVLGDSITAGYGLRPEWALPAQLQEEMGRIGFPARIRALGVSGDTTAKGLARLDTPLAPTADLWVVALGGNDLLLGLDPTETRVNLEKIVDKLRRRGAPVVLAGVRAPTFLGRAYAAAFDSVFAEVARTRELHFYPNLLDRVMGVRALNQPDGIHPNARGVKLIAQGLAPVVAQALSRKV